MCEYRSIFQIIPFQFFLFSGIERSKVRIARQPNAVVVEGLTILSDFQAVTIRVHAPGEGASVVVRKAGADFLIPDFTHHGTLNSGAANMDFSRPEYFDCKKMPNSTHERPHWF